MTEERSRRVHELAAGDGILLALEERATRLIRAGRFEQAEHTIRRLIDLDEHRLAAWRLLGECHLACGAFSNAFVAFQTASRIGDPDPWSACRAGESLFYSGQQMSAIKWLKFAAQTAGPDQPWARRRARILLRRANSRT